MQCTEPQTNKCQNCCLANGHIEEKKDSLHASDNLFYQENCIYFAFVHLKKMTDMQKCDTIQIQSS